MRWKEGERIKIVTAREPSPEATLRAALRLLGWKPGEVEREVEELRREGAGEVPRDEAA